MNLQNGFSTLLICLFTVIISPAQGVDEGIEHIIDRFKNPSPNYILVVSHRGDWRYAPENSLAAIQRCIDLGVDVVEIDVRKTKDDHLSSHA